MAINPITKAYEVDWSVYLVTDPMLVGSRSLTEVVAASIRGGVRVVQYRDKGASTREMLAMAAGLAAVCRRLGAWFLVNDRLDVALAVDAAGVLATAQEVLAVLS